MDENRIYSVFQNIEEGDMVRVKYESYQEFEHEAKIVEGSGEDKIVSFLIPQTEPKLVYEYEKVRLEQRALGEPKGWSEYLKLNELEIL